MLAAYANPKNPHEVQYVQIVACLRFSTVTKKTSCSKQCTKVQRQSMLLVICGPSRKHPIPVALHSYRGWADGLRNTPHDWHQAYVKGCRRQYELHIQMFDAFS